MKLFVTSFLAAVLALPAVSSFAAEAGHAAPAVAAAAPVAAKVIKPDLVKGEASYTAVCVSCHGAGPGFAGGLDSKRALLSFKRRVAAGDRTPMPFVERVLALF